MKKTLLACLLLVSSAILAPVQAETSWTGYTYLASGTSAGSEAMQKLADEFAERSEGAIKIQLNLAGSLPIKAADITQSVADGILDISADGFFLGNIEEGGVLRLPMIFNTLDEFNKGLSAVTPYLDKAFADIGVVLLAQYLYPLQVAWGTDQITSLADLKGKKLRVSSPEQGAFVTAFGGAPVTIGGAEVPTALQTGAVEGVFTASVGGGRLWKDQLKSTYRLGPNFFNSAIIVNKTAFDALSTGDQALLRELAVKYAAAATARQMSEETAVTAELAAGGIKVYEPTTADVATAIETMKPYWQEWAGSKKPTTQAAMAAALKAIGQ